MFSVLFPKDPPQGGFFFYDFYCAKLRLIIEIDGKIHEKQSAYDRERDEKLYSKGILVVRIKNEELSDINLVIDKLSKTVKARENEILNYKEQLECLRGCRKSPVHLIICPLAPKGGLYSVENQQVPFRGFRGKTN